MDKRAITQGKNGIVIEVLVQPKAAHNEIVGLHGDRIKIKLTAPPVEGKANSALIALLSDRLRVPRSSIVILRGETGRRKTVVVSGIVLSDADRLLNTVG